MKKILFLIGNLDGGGAEKVLITLVNSLAEQYDITVQTVYDEGLYISQLHPNIKYKTNITYPNSFKKHIVWNIVKFFPRKLLHNLFIKGKYDIEVGFLEGMCNKIISGAKASIKKYAWIHTDVQQIPKRSSGFVGAQLERNAYNCFDRIICVSEDAKSAVVGKLKPIKEPIVIYNPIDSQDILKKAIELEGKIKKEKFTICAVGRLVEEKGFDRLIQATADLCKQGYDFDVLILGQGDLEDSLKRLVNQFNISNYVKFLGYIENPYPYIRSSDLYVCSSRLEGYSLTVAEAIVLGTPVMSTSCTGPVELLDGGKYGTIVENSTEGIYKGIKELLDNPEELDMLRKKANKRADFFDLQQTVNQVVALLDGDGNNK
jgi:glycosyltransferase involved in cell wall biosynthesis